MGEFEHLVLNHPTPEIIDHVLDYKACTRIELTNMTVDDSTFVNTLQQVRGVSYVRFINLKCDGCWTENPDDDLFKLREFLKKDEAEERKEAEDKSEEEKIFDVQKVKKSWVYKVE